MYFVIVPDFYIQITDVYHMGRKKNLTQSYKWRRHNTKNKSKYLQKYIDLVYNVYCLLVSEVNFMAFLYSVFQFVASVFFFLVEYKFFQGILYSWNMFYSFFISSQTTPKCGSAIHKIDN